MNLARSFGPVRSLSVPNVTITYSTGAKEKDVSRCWEPDVQVDSDEVSEVRKQ